MQRGKIWLESSGRLESFVTSREEIRMQIQERIKHLLVVMLGALVIAG